ncbi:hypothetical protein PanWU01x14_244240 [Parasponia andersonii]|uniref:Uncharacterized protein n=1 Tax=Parasponia andersonii TaxID=3476 RepID=A0A2P5BF93_PARAD|nr:hypothetical protein PanWU01x14_244240 [Parasponia andersonii]
METAPGGVANQDPYQEARLLDYRQVLDSLKCKALAKDKSDAESAESFQGKHYQITLNNRDHKSTTQGS